MAGKTLSNVSDEATEKTNTTNELTPILEIQPDNGLVLVLLNQVAKGNEMGIPIAAKLKDSSDNDLPLDSDLALGFQAPSERTWTVVSEVVGDIEVYRRLSLTQQRKEDYIDATKVELKGNNRALAAEDVDKIYVLLDSSTAIDWANSRLSFDADAVREMSEDEYRSQFQGR